jgi:hypothetical protein
MQEVHEKAIRESWRSKRRSCPLWQPTNGQTTREEAEDFLSAASRGDGLKSRNRGPDQRVITTKLYYTIPLRDV